MGEQGIRRALECLAVDPGLHGLLIAGGPGTGKSHTARSFRGLAPFVELPPGVTEEALLGGLDIERTLRSGVPTIAAGLLARANGGVLYADEVNLLDRRVARVIAGALNSGMVQIERDGVSAARAAAFAFIGTYDPEEGEADAAIQDAVGLHAFAPATSAAERLKVLKRSLDPAAFAERGEAAEGITAARSLLFHVKIATADRDRLSAEALRLGVEGHRADIFAVRCARACAAIDGCGSVKPEHLKAAVEFVLLPRATQAIARESPAVEVTARERGAGSPSRAPTKDQPVPVCANPAPEGVLEGARPARERRSPQSGAARNRPPAGVTAWNRGRYVRAVIRKPQGGKIAPVATLCAAAAAGRRRVSPEDVRYKQFTQKQGTLILFVVDASGSMAANRISQAKGALIQLLQKAYLRRDSVALVSCRGERAAVLLSPTRSVELAKRALDALPAGGGTPLASGLCAARRIAEQARHSGRKQTLLVLLTDGRPNVAAGTGQDIWRELEGVAMALRSDGISPVVIDTSERAAASDGAERLARMLGGAYLRLPRPRAGAILNALALARPAGQAGTT